MIKLTTTETYEYFAIPVPKDAKDIEQSHFHLFYEMTGHLIEKSIYIGKEFELLGVIGQGSEISVEVAEEVIGWKYCEPYRDHAIQELKNMFSQLGILVENQVQKPLYHPKYYDELNHWKYTESKLVKAVIIKVKK